MFLFRLTKCLHHLGISFGVVQNLELLNGHAVLLEEILALELEEVQVAHGHLSPEDKQSGDKGQPNFSLAKSLSDGRKPYERCCGLWRLLLAKTTSWLFFVGK